MTARYHLSFWRRDLRLGTIEHIPFTAEIAPQRFTKNGVPDISAHHLIDYFNAREARRVAPCFIYWLQA